jgi:hypothetical protein
MTEERYIYVYDHYHKRCEELLSDSLDSLLNRVAVEIDENFSCPIEIRNSNRELIMDEKTLRDKAHRIIDSWYRK